VFADIKTANNEVRLYNFIITSSIHSIIWLSSIKSLKSLSYSKFVTVSSFVLVVKKQTQNFFYFLQNKISNWIGPHVFNFQALTLLNFRSHPSCFLTIYLFSIFFCCCCYRCCCYRCCCRCRCCRCCYRCRWHCRYSCRCCYRCRWHCRYSCLCCRCLRHFSRVRL